MKKVLAALLLVGFGLIFAGKTLAECNGPTSELFDILKEKYCNGNNGNSSNNS